MENVSQDERYVFAACATESHGVCKDCIGRYVRDLVKDGRIGQVGCHECQAAASSQEVLNLTDQNCYDRFERFRKMRLDPTVRECPSCGSLCKPVLDSDEN